MQLEIDLRITAQIKLAEGKELKLFYAKAIPTPPVGLKPSCNYPPVGCVTQRVGFRNPEKGKTKQFRNHGTCLVPFNTMVDHARVSGAPTPSHATQSLPFA